MRTDSRDRKDTVRQYLRNIQREVDSAALYRALSVEERTPEIAEVYKRLAAIEQAHKQFWKERLSGLGHQVPDFSLGWRTRTLIWLARRCGSDFVLPVVSTREHADVRYYEAQSEAVADGLNVAERSHARIIRAVAASMPNMSIGPLTNALRAAVLGANDGLASNFESAGRMPSSKDRRWPSLSRGSSICCTARLMNRRSNGATDMNAPLLLAVSDDSMEPTIAQGDFLLIDRAFSMRRTTLERAQRKERSPHDGIYAFRSHFLQNSAKGTTGHLVVRRLQYRLNATMVVGCDNQRYPEEIYSLKAKNLPKPVGRVIWRADRV